MSSRFLSKQFWAYAAGAVLDNAILGGFAGAALAFTFVFAASAGAGHIRLPSTAELTGAASAGAGLLIGTRAITEGLMR